MWRCPRCRGSTAQKRGSAHLLLYSPARNGFVERFIIGRPFEISAAALMTILWLWQTHRGAPPSRRDTIIMTAAIAVAVLLHGSWYLWVLPIVAFVIARELIWARQLTIAWLVGTVIGAVLTDHPLDYVVESVRMGLDAFSSPHYVTTLVREFQPLPANVPGLLVLAALAWYHDLAKDAHGMVSESTIRARLHGLRAGLHRHAASGATGACRPCSWPWWWKSRRSWRCASGQHRSSDWLFSRCPEPPVFLIATSDAEGRWSTPRLQTFYLKSSDPALAGWAASITAAFSIPPRWECFYETFYANPEADWRYQVGFEPAMMPRQDFATYERILVNHGNPLAYLPWIEKMRPEDRVVFHWPSQPQLAQLKWHSVGNLVDWVGCLAATWLAVASVR